MQKDTGFNEKLVTYLYALEVQQLVESGEEGSLADVQEAYDIPQEKAEQIVEVSTEDSTFSDILFIVVFLLSGFLSILKYITFLCFVMI